MYVYNSGSSRKVLWACWPTSLAETANFRFNERPSLKKVRRRSNWEKASRCQPLGSMCIYTGKCSCTLMHVRMYTRTHTTFGFSSTMKDCTWTLVWFKILCWPSPEHFREQWGKDPVTFQSSEEGSRREKWAATLISWNEALALPSVQAEVLLGLLKMFLQGRKSESILGFDKEESHCSCWDSHPRIKGPMRHHNLEYLLEMQRGWAGMRSPIPSRVPEQKKKKTPQTGWLRNNKSYFSLVLVFLCKRHKQDELHKKGSWASQGSKPLSRISSWSLLQLLTPLSCPEFLPWLPCLMDYNL